MRPGGGPDRRRGGARRKPEIEGERLVAKRAYARGMQPLWSRTFMLLAALVGIGLAVAIPADVKDYVRAVLWAGFILIVVYTVQIGLLSRKIEQMMGQRPGRMLPNYVKLMALALLLALLGPCVEAIYRWHHQFVWHGTPLGLTAEIVALLGLDIMWRWEIARAGSLEGQGYAGEKEQG